MVWYAPTSAMYAAARPITPKQTSRPYIQGRAASAGPPETRACTNPTRQTSTATVSSMAPVRRNFSMPLYTSKLAPQEHDLRARGLSKRKLGPRGRSMMVPVRSGALAGSTAMRTPSDSTTASCGPASGTK
jgi:hypothetical protein